MRLEGRRSYARMNHRLVAHACILFAFDRAAVQSCLIVGMVTQAPASSTCARSTGTCQLNALPMATIKSLAMLRTASRCSLILARC